jgi:hypothetical protein
MFAVRDILIFSAIAGLLAAGALALWPWARRDGRFVIAGVTAAAGMTAWNFVLHWSNTASLNVDAPVIALSWQDVGTGVWACTVTALVLGLFMARQEPANRIAGAAGLAGLVAMIFDIFVL